MQKKDAYRKALACILLLTPPLLAEPARSIKAVRCDVPPVIDGKLDDTEWSRAPALTDLTAIQPTPGRPMSERTEARVLFDQKALYLGIRCFDSNPAGISARGRERDGTVTSGDYVSFFFDTFSDHRNGYVFAVSPDEGRDDALVSNHFNKDSDWDGIWRVRCTADAEGWTAEVAIPFKSLSYDSQCNSWGFNFSRSIARKGELGMWNDSRPESKVYYAGNAGSLTGLDNLPKHLGFEFSPYMLGRYRNHDGGEKGFSGDVGFDVRWRIGSGLNATVSVNTDFAETEVDQRKLNFTRFPLFFPEKRRFFKEDSGIYQFADLNESLLIPYYSRRIGLSDSGEPVAILGAGKLSGRAGGYELGATAALLDEAFGVDSKPVFAGRLSRQVFGDSTIGAIATVGDPNSNGDNYLLGVDFRYQNTEWMQNETLVTNVFFLGTGTNPVDDADFSGHAFGFGLACPGDRIELELKAAEVSRGFDPALGYIKRKDIRYLSGKCGYRIRPEKPTWWQSYSVSYGSKVYTDLDNNLQTLTHSVYPLILQFPNNDELSFGIVEVTDKPDYDWSLAGDITVPAGDYDMLTYYLSLKLGGSRTFGGDVGTSWGDFYGGDWYSAHTNLWWIPMSLISCGLSYDYEHFDMPGGLLDSQTVSLWLNLRFTPRVRWANLIQYDTVSESIGLNSRFSWEYREGHRLDLVLSQLYQDGTPTYELVDSELVAKVIMQLRF